MNRKAAGILTMIFTFSVLEMTVMAADPITVYTGEYKTQDNQIQIQVGDNLTVDNADRQYTVALGDQQLDVQNVKKFADSGEHVSYLFLADVSGSIKSDTSDQMKKAIESVIKSMDTEDNACIMTVGNNAYAGDFSSDQKQLTDQVEKINRLHEDTNLYYGIEQALSILDTSDQVNERKCLVIFSDGKDDQVRGITKEEVTKKIEEVHIPICSVAMLGKKPADGAVDYGKILGEFARLSPGGQYILYNGKTADLAETITGVADHCNILYADLTGYQGNGTDVRLKVQLNAKGIGSAEDGYDIDSADISEAVTKSTESMTQESSDSNSAMVTDEKNEPQRISEGSVAGLIFIFVLALSCVVAILTRMKKENKKKIRKENAEEKKPVADKEIAEDQTDMKNDDPVKETAPIWEHEIKIKLIKLGQNEEEEEVSVVIHDNAVIGRNAVLSDVAFENDELLSGAHCRLSYDGKNIYIEDLHSTNGTMLNGVPLKEKYPVACDDVISLGASEWRIIW
ncbi:MAG: FHA domain-containing protein [Butyrivibrio sp.]|jgi:hypothetical protein|nr:FHA domain-containing protein [Butyrivibrio sp.]